MYRHGGMRPIGRVAAALLAMLLLLHPAGTLAQDKPPRVSGTIAEFLGQGDAAFRRGDFATASQAWREAARMCRVQGRPDAESESLVRSAEANLALGFVAAAVVELRGALEAAQQTGDERLIGAVTGALGNAQLIARQYQDAEANIERSIELARRLDDRATLAASTNNLANLYAATSRADEALERYRESAAIATTVGDPQLRTVALRNAGRIQFRRGELDLALASLQQASLAADGIPASHLRIMTLVSIGNLIGITDQRNQGMAAAYAILRKAVEQAEAAADARGQSLAFGYMGRLYELHGRSAEAMLLTDRALDLAQREKLPELLYRWDWQQARLLLAGGDEAGALEAYIRAVRELQEIRRDIPIDYEEGRSSFRETIGPLFLQLADLLMRRASKAGDIAEVNRFLAQARDTVEKIKTAELQDYFKDQCVDTVARKTVKIEEVAPQTAVIYPIILGDRLELLVSFAEGDTFATAAVTEKELGETVRALRTALQDLTSSRTQYLGLSKRVYDWVIGPIAGVLKSRNVQTLVFVPDGPLRTIPIAALYDGTRFLVESYAIATAPGLTLIDPTPLPRQKMTALVAGISDAVQGFEAIPDARVEVDTISERLNATKMLNRTFLLSAFEQQLQSQPYKIVHIASHAGFGGTAEDSFVLAYDTKITMNKIEELFKFNRAQPEPVELLTLSACSTAEGDDRAPLGLAGVALKSGARSSIASLWSVIDVATAELSADMYAQLQDTNATKAEALRQAQVRMVRSGKFSHPAFWSPFLLIGNWL